MRQCVGVCVCLGVTWDISSSLSEPEHYSGSGSDRWNARFTGSVSLPEPGGPETPETPDSPDSLDSPDPAETQHPVRNRPWVPRAGGQDDGSLHKLPQIKGWEGVLGEWCGWASGVGLLSRNLHSVRFQSLHLDSASGGLVRTNYLPADQ